MVKLALAVLTACLFAVDAKYDSIPNSERSNEYNIKRMVLSHYDKTTRPVHNDSKTVGVNVAISLYHILDVNEKEQTITTQVAIRQRWRDESLVWNKDEYGGISQIRIPANQIWTPDLIISNFAGDKFNNFMVTNAIVSAEGEVLWLYPALIKTYCTLNVKYFPFDSQNCDFEFISWTHSGEQLDIVYSSSFPNTVYYNPENQQWAVDSISAERHVKFYACCKEPYPDVTFTIHMRRGSLFHIVSLIIPNFLIFLISFLGFFLPVESGHKVNLEAIIFLALVVFLVFVGETLPPAPDAISILWIYFGMNVVLVAVALVMAVITTNLYAKKDSAVECPRCLVRKTPTFFPRVIVPSSKALEDERSKHDSDTERMEAEWIFVSKYMDWVFFWLYVVIGLIVQVVLFAQMVPH